MPVSRVIFIAVIFLASDLWGQFPDSLRPVPAGARPDSAAGTAADSTRLPPPILSGPGFLRPRGSGAPENYAIQSIQAIPDSLMVFTEFRSPADLLRPMGGVFVLESGLGGPGRLSSVHGLRPGSIAFLADGLLLNDPSTGSFEAELYPVGFCERIEIAAPGTGSYYGLNGVGGAVNFVSRNIRAVRPVSTIRYSQSAYGYSAFDGSVTQDVSRGLNVSIGVRRPVNDDGYLNSALDGWGARVKVRYDLEGAAIYISNIFNRWTRGLNDGVSLSTPDSLRFDRIRATVVNESATEMLLRHDLRAGVSFGGSADLADLTVFDLQLGSRTRRYIDEAGGTGSTGVPFRDIRREQTTAFRFNHSRPLGGQVFSAGLEMRSRRLLQDPGVGSHRTTQAGVFALLELKPFPSLTLVPTARFDRTMDLGRFSAGVDAGLRLAGPVLLRGSLSRSHRFPSFIEAYGMDSAATPLPVVEPERHDLVSGGFTVGDPEGTFFSAEFYHRNVANAVTLDTSSVPGQPPYAFGAVPKESRRGGTISARLVAGSIVGEAAVDALGYGEGSGRRYSPAWSVEAGVYFRNRLVGGHLDLKAGFRGRYFTSYDGGRLSRRYETYLPSSVSIPPAGTLDFVLVAGLGDAFIHFIWENLLDREYFMEVLYPADDRSIRFGVTWNFLD